MLCKKKKKLLSLLKIYRKLSPSRNLLCKFICLEKLGKSNIGDAKFA